MKISIERLLTIRQRDFNALNRAFSLALVDTDNYTNPDYSLTLDDARKVEAELAKIADEAEQDNDLFPRTPQQKMADIREACMAAEAFRDLWYNYFSQQ